MRQSDTTLPAAAAAPADLTRQLIDHASLVAEQADLPLHIQGSAASESVYLRVHRSGHWFGLRLSAHPAAHPSSSDFQQLLLPVNNPPSDDFVRMAKRQVEHFIRLGGVVVADPEETEAAIRNCFLNRQRAESGRRLPLVSEICAIRSRLNLRARWSYEIEQAAQNGRIAVSKRR